MDDNKISTTETAPAKPTMPQQRLVRPNNLRLAAKSNSCSHMDLDFDIEDNDVKRKSDPSQNSTQTQDDETSVKRTTTVEICNDQLKKRYSSSRKPSPLSQTVFVLFVLFFVTLAAGAESTEFSICHNEHKFSRRDLHAYVHEKRQTKDVVGQLFDWCSSSSLCAEAYHISTARTTKDEKAFRYIARHWLQMKDGTVDLLRPFNETVCENESFDELLKTLWVVAMRLHVKESIRIECGANEKVVFDTETLQMHCECIADRNCLDSSVWRGSSLNWSNVTTTIAGIVLIIVVFQQLLLSVERRRTYHRLYLQCKEKCGGTREEFIKQL